MQLACDSMWYQAKLM